MESKDTNNFVLEDQDAQLERMFFEEYLHSRGYTLADLSRLLEAEAKRILTEASTYASVKVAGVKDKAEFVRKLHGATERS